MTSLSNFAIFFRHWNLFSLAHCFKVFVSEPLKQFGATSHHHLCLEVHGASKIERPRLAGLHLIHSWCEWKIESLHQTKTNVLFLFLQIQGQPKSSTNSSTKHFDGNGVKIQVMNSRWINLQRRDVNYPTNNVHRSILCAGFKIKHWKFASTEFSSHHCDDPEKTHSNLRIATHNE